MSNSSVPVPVQAHASGAEPRLDRRLIGGLVVDEARSGTFLFADYFGRRMRRIVPVMVVMLAAVSVAADLLLLPNELSGFGESLGASALFAANVHF